MRSERAAVESSSCITSECGYVVVVLVCVLLSDSFSSSTFGKLVRSVPHSSPADGDSMHYLMFKVMLGPLVVFYLAMLQHRSNRPWHLIFELFKKDSFSFVVHRMMSCSFEFSVSWDAPGLSLAVPMLGTGCHHCLTGLFLDTDRQPKVG
eukprot:4067071-Amphidinium_carterae.1